MAAPEFDELLSAYLDGEVTAEERALVEQRLEQSPALRETLDEYADVGEAVRGLPRRGAPVDLPERVLARLRTRAPQVRPSGGSPGSDRSRRRKWFLGGVATAASALVVGTLFWGPQRAALGPDVALQGGARPDSRIAPMSAAAPVAVAAAAKGAGAPRRDSDLVKELVERMKGEQPRELDIVRVLETHADEIEVIEMFVVDRINMGDETRTLLMKNGLNVVEVAVPTANSPASAAAKPTSFAVYVEGEDARIEQTLDELQQRAWNTYDYGNLGDITQTARSAVLAEKTGVVTNPAEGLESVDSKQARGEGEPSLAKSIDNEPPKDAVEPPAPAPNVAPFDAGPPPTDAPAPAESPAVPPQPDPEALTQQAVLPAPTAMESATTATLPPMFSNSAIQLPDPTTRQLQELVQNSANTRQQYGRGSRSRAAQTRLKTDNVQEKLSTQAQADAPANRRMLLIFQSAEEEVHPASPAPAAEPAK